MLLVVCACADTAPDYPQRPDGSSPSSGAPGGTPAGQGVGLPTGASTGSPTTSVWTTSFDCVDRYPGPFPTTTFDIYTEEDFSFDLDGHLVYQAGTSVMGAAQGGASAVLATGAPGDPAGLDVIADNLLLIAGPDTGTLRQFDLTSGGGLTLLSSVDRPNSVLGDRGGLAYVAEMYAGRVRWYDPATDQQGSVASGLGTANGMTLSPDESTMYIGGTQDVWAVERDPATGEWDPDSRWLFWSAPTGSIFALETDVCGWVYVVGYSDGMLRRISPDGGTVEPLAQLSGGWAWSGMNFGNGVGGWAEDVLYLTNRGNVVGVYIGIPGSPGPNLP